MRDGGRGEEMEGEVEEQRHRRGSGGTGAEVEEELEVWGVWRGQAGE